jgi:hypothetical protein
MKRLKFAISDYLPAIKPIIEVVSGPHTEFHALLRPYPPLLLGESTVTTIITIYFPSDAKARLIDSLPNAIQELLAKRDSRYSAAKAYAGGWAHESLPVPGRPDPGCAFVALLGWEDLGQQLKSGDIAQLKDDIGSLPAAAQLQGVDVAHVRCKKFVP